MGKFWVIENYLWEGENKPRVASKSRLDAFLAEWPPVQRERDSGTSIEIAFVEVTEIIKLGSLPEERSVETFRLMFRTLQGSDGKPFFPFAIAKDLDSTFISRSINTDGKIENLPFSFHMTFEDAKKVLMEIWRAAEDAGKLTGFFYTAPARHYTTKHVRLVSDKAASEIVSIMEKTWGV